MSTLHGTSLLKRPVGLSDLRPLLPWLGLLVLVLAACWPAIYPEFIWDDLDYLVGCNAVKNSHGLYEIWLVPGATPHYFPVVFTSWWFEYRLWGMNLIAYHAANLFYHALAAGLLWLVLRRLKVPGAWIAAALWAVHPMQVETVAWLTERKNIFGAIFFFLAILAYLHMPETGRLKRALWYLATILAAAAAILSKQVMAVLPVVLILIDCWRDQGLKLARLKWTLPLLVPAALVAWIGIHQERHWVGTLGTEFNFTLDQRFAIAGRSLLFYLQKFLFPWPLLTVYPRFDLHAILIPGIALFALAMLVLAVLLLLRRRLGIGPVLLSASFIIILLPALGFISFYTQLYTFVADHYAYLALAALTIGLTCLLVRFCPPRVAHIIAGVLIAACVALSCNVSFLYRSQLALWQHTLKYNPNSWVALNNTAVLLAKQIQTRNPLATLNDFREPIALYQKAASINPDWRTYDGLAFLYLQIGSMPEAVAAYQQAEALIPEGARRSDAQRGIYRDSYQFKVAFRYKELGKLDDAVIWFRHATEARPTEAGSWAELGNCLAATGQLEPALAAYTRVVELEPRAADYWLRRGLILRQLGRDEEGIQSILKARDLDPAAIQRVMNTK